MAAHYLALDQGGHASRAILFDAAGNKVDEAFAAITTQRDADGVRVEHDPEELIASLSAVIAEVCTRAAAAGRRVAAAGLATQRSSMVCWNRVTGAALSPVLSWQDRRNAAWLQQFQSRRDWIRARTGLVLTPHYGASKMRWCLDNLPAVAQAAGRGELALGPLSSFILFRLLGRRPFVVDPANASRTQLWDPALRDWSDDLLQLFGVPRTALPGCVTSRFAYGDLATPCGAVPLTVATGDQSAVPFAFGPLDGTAAYINVGTGAFVQRAVRDRLPEAPRLLASVVWSDAAGVDYMIEGTVNGAGSALDWFAQRERADVAAMLSGLQLLPGGVEPPLFRNGVAGLGSPFWVSDLDSGFVGEGDASARLHAVLESIVFLIRVNLEELKPHGPPLTRLVLTGGLSSSDIFCRRLADLAALPVWRSRETEATARGLAALVAAPMTPWPPGPGDVIPPGSDPALVARFLRWCAVMPRVAEAGSRPR